MGAEDRRACRPARQSSGTILEMDKKICMHGLPLMRADDHLGSSCVRRWRRRRTLQQAGAPAAATQVAAGISVPSHTAAASGSPSVPMWSLESEWPSQHITPQGLARRALCDCASR
ncbi:hypothetical protein WOLCODRAFT_151822 [Wolfiporia cocos MD-104 SS10]|uniref:Uncharacterized protein n=1 Tax=Wolfiporia cocos (strain MD-104) TaxID=742152 RepID=A0A2H3JHV4_WOLCO|nr:hypothetical protein WOLCODRAFT_151822 [Wolfiporia cocos MD-104 SS10]